MKDNKFSAFRLFYDEFLYKTSPLADYTGVEQNVANIRNIARDMRNTYPGSSDDMDKLNDAHSKIKKELDSIANTNASLFNGFHSEYKKAISFGTDTPAEMPFVIATSFYNDYRVDDNGKLDYSILIPRYTSLEKKQIRDYYKENGLLDLFLHLLRNGECNYNLLITKIEYLKVLTVSYNETFNDFRLFMRKIKRIKLFYIMK